VLVVGAGPTGLTLAAQLQAVGAAVRIIDRHSPAVQEGRPAPGRGPRAGDRLPDARVARDGQVGWLGEALAAPRFHLLLCGAVGDWDPSQLAALGSRHPDLLAVHHLTREAVPGALHDVDGQVLARLGVNEAAHYLIRPDGHISYRAAGTDLNELRHYLARGQPSLP
jgi:aromatic ring hydroxylase-like protein/FAD binding domain-containing protein